MMKIDTERKIPYEEFPIYLWKCLHLYDKGALLKNTA